MSKLFEVLFGVEELKENTNIFPNPSSGIVYISQDNVRNSEVRVYSMLGKEVYSNTLLGSLRMDLSTFNNGVYFIEINNGQEKMTERLILNR